ncbi:MAG: VOC family protein [Acidobacteriota bacterium]|nr:VOC family protein [Acidobacteriota bacterium]
MEEAIAWLSNAFGFAEHYRYGNPLSGAQMKAENAWIMLKQLKPEGRTPGELGFGTQSLTVFVEDLETHFARAREAGVTLEENLHETVYGEFQYAARDLDGHHWLFSRHARDLSPDQWGAVVARADLSTGRQKA